MTVTLSAEIDGKHVPLTDCDWVLFGSCGALTNALQNAQQAISGLYVKGESGA